MNPLSKSPIQFPATKTEFYVLLDTQGTIVHADAVLALLTQTDPDELTGSSVFSLVAPNDRLPLIDLLHTREDAAGTPVSWTLCNQHGNALPYRFSLIPLVLDLQEYWLMPCRLVTDERIQAQKFAAIFDNHQIMMAVTDRDTGLFINVNRAFQERLGYMSEEVIGKTSGELGLFQNLQDRKIVIDQLPATNPQLEDVPLTVKTKDGSLLSCLFSVRSFDLQNHHLLLTSAVDITQQQEAQRRLTNQLRQQKLLAEISQRLLNTDHYLEQLQEIVAILGTHTGVSRVYIFENDADNRTTSNTVEWCNEGITAQIGELQQVPYEVIPSWKQMLETEGRVLCHNIQLLPQDVYEILQPQGIQSILVYAFRAGSKFTGFMGFDECTHQKIWQEDELDLLKTITNIIAATLERVQFQRQIAESEARLKMAVDHSRLGLWDSNMVTGQSYYNEHWASMIGYRTDEIAADTHFWESLIHPEDKEAVTEAMNRHIGGEIPFYEATYRLRNKNGEWTWIMGRGKVVDRLPDGRPLRALGTHINIDPLKRAEQELLQANQTKDKFFSIIAHDLRGPISTMMKISELVARKGLLNETDLYRFLNSQVEISRNTYDLLENLLQWARLNRSQITPHPRNIELEPLIHQLVQASKYRIEAKKLQIDLNTVPGLRVWADEEMLKLIIRNLLSNAIKFTPQQGCITITTTQNEQNLFVQITDTGAGMTAEALNHVLHSNEFITTTGTDNEKGTGLGLKLCGQFAELNGGSLTVSSQPGTGATFTLNLPAAP